MKKIVSVFLLISLVFSFEACKTTSNSASKPLSFNLGTGKSYDYDMQFEMDQSMMAQNSKMKFNTLYSVDVVNDSAGIKTLRGTYRNFRMNADIMGMKMDIDTDRPDTSKPSPENPMGMMSRIFSMIKGTSFTMKIDKKGNVLAVSGAEKFRDMFVSFADSMGMEEKEMNSVKESFSEQFNEEAVKSQFSQVFTIFPDKEVKEGDSWEIVTKGDIKMPTTNTTKYTVKEIEGDMITLVAKTKIEGTENKEFQIEGEQEGNLIVDSRSGLVIRSEYNQNLYVKAQGMTIGIKGKGNITGKERL